MPRSDVEKSAASAAQGWLGINDAGRYAESWKAAAQFFQNAVAVKEWEDSMIKYRKPLGTSCRGG